MDLLEQKKYVCLNNWFASPQGTKVAQAFSLELSKISGYISGKYLLQIGSTAKNNLLEHLYYRNKLIVDPATNTKNVSCVAKPNYLPFAIKSFDCILAPFTMELCTRHLTVLSEFDTILSPDGFVILFGINPISFWGAAVYLKRLKLFSKLQLNLHSLISIKNNLLALGYRQCYLSSFYYIPPVNSPKLINNLEFLNEMGKMMWPYPASFYCLIAQKCEEGLHLLRDEQEDIDFAFKPN